MITVIRVGTRRGEITLEAAEAFRRAEKVILHTGRCGCAEWLRENGIAFTALDDLYETSEDFDEQARLSAEAVTAFSGADVCYGVLDLADESVKRILRSGAKVRVLGGGDAEALLARAEGPVHMLCAMDLDGAILHGSQNTLVREIDSRTLAGEVKIRLMEHYPEEETIFVQKPDGEIAVCPLTDLDRLREYDHRAACLVPAVSDLTRLERCDFEDLRRLTALLRDPERGCPWDAEQTHVSFKRSCVEEAYELEDAIDSGDDAGIIEELGDLLFVTAMHIQIGEDHGDFDAGDVLTGIVKKMIFRHRHVFGDEKAENIDDLLRIWNDAKKEEKALLTVADEMRAVAKGFPALTRARKVLKRAFADGERASRTLEAMNDGSAAYRLLSIANELRLADRDAEGELQDAVKRFIDLFENGGSHI